MVPCASIVNVRLFSYSFYYKLLRTLEYASTGRLIAHGYRITGRGDDRQCR